ncbi:MAG: hypothetical protein RL367_2562 [Pseudomonadota bacterium]|jgi:hypothetical protein
MRSSSTFIAALSAIILLASPGESRHRKANVALATLPLPPLIDPVDAVPGSGHERGRHERPHDEVRFFVGKMANSNSAETRWTAANTAKRRGRVIDISWSFDPAITAGEVFSRIESALLLNRFMTRYRCLGKACDSGQTPSEFQFSQTVYQGAMIDPQPWRRAMVNSSAMIRYGVFERPEVTVIVYAARNGDGQTMLHIEQVFPAG